MKLKSDMIARKVAGQTVLLDLSKDESDDKMVSTNGTGAFLVEQLQKGCTEEELLSALLEKYDVTEETAKEHIALFLDGLNSLGFLAE